MISQFFAELTGTFILTLLGNGVVAGVLLNKSKAQNAGWLVIAIAWGLAVAIAIYAVGNISGAHINPAVTLGLATIGELSWSVVPVYISAQVTGAFLGAIAVYIHYLPHWRGTEDALLKRAVFCTDPAIPSRWANLMSEVVGTFVLLMGILAIGANEFTEGLNPLVVGLLVLCIGLSLGGTTGWAINPARDFGPRLAHFLLPIPGKTHSNWNYAWIPIVGPIFGGMYGSLLYQAVFHQELPLLFWVGSVMFLCLIFLVFWEDSKKAAPSSEK